MDSNLLRSFDRVLGVPMCAFLSALRRAWGWGTKRQNRHASGIGRVLFIQLAESGSMVLADPAMRAVAVRAGAQVYCLTFASNRASLSIAGSVPDERIFCVRADGIATLLVDLPRVWWHLRRARIDAVVDLELFSRLSAAFCFLTGIRRRAGFHRFNEVGAYRGDLYTHPVAFNPHLHVAQNYLMLVEALLHTGDGPAPRVASDGLVPQVRLRAVDAAARDSVVARLQAQLGAQASNRLVLVNANASAMLPQRRWPPAHFVSLIRAVLAQHDDVTVLLIGADEDRATTGAIAAEVGDVRCADVAGAFSLPELPALFAMSAAMVSNDSGPAHFASVTRLPVIALFGPETPILFRPLGRATVLSAGLACSPCVNVGNQRHTRCTDNQCMKRITVEEVRSALEAALLRRSVDAAPASSPKVAREAVEA